MPIAVTLLKSGKIDKFLHSSKVLSFIIDKFDVPSISIKEVHPLKHELPNSSIDTGKVILVIPSQFKNALSSIFVTGKLLINSGTTTSLDKFFPLIIVALVLFNE